MFNAGVHKSYFYELVGGGDVSRLRPDERDPGTESLPTRRSQTCWGCLKTLVRVSSPGALSYTLTNAGADVHHTLLQKRDGSYYLALWIEESGYNEVTNVVTPGTGAEGRAGAEGMPKVEEVYLFNDHGTYAKWGTEEPVEYSTYAERYGDGGEDRCGLASVAQTKPGRPCPAAYGGRGLFICYASAGDHFAMRFAVPAVLAFTLTCVLGAAAQSAPSIDVPAKEKLVMEPMGHGVQIYTCAEKDGEWTWTFKAPEAKLTDAFGKVIGNHFAGPKWRLTDGSEVQGKLIAAQPHGGTIPWLLLSATSTGGKGQLSSVNIVRRTGTQGGNAPMSGCDMAHAGGRNACAVYGDVQLLLGTLTMSLTPEVPAVR